MSAFRHHLTGTRLVIWIALFSVALGMTFSGAAAARPALERGQKQTAKHTKKHSKKKKRARHKARAADQAINLCAKQRDDFPLPGGGTAAVWGFAVKPLDTACSDSSVVAQFPAPVLDVGAGDNVTINVENLLPDALSLDIPGIVLGPPGRHRSRRARAARSPSCRRAPARTCTRAAGMPDASPSSASPAP